MSSQKHTTKKVSLTNTLIDKMPLPKKTPRKGKRPKYNVSELRDTQIPGFFVRATTEGKKTFYLYFRDKLDKKQYNLEIGVYPQMGVPKARTEARKELGKVAAGRNPHKERRSIITAGTLAEYSQLYIKALMPTKSSAKETYIHEKYIRPGLGKYRLIDLKPVDVELYRNTMIHTPSQANQVKVYLHKFFVWCIKNQYMTTNPAAGIKNLKEKRRQFVATDTQLQKISKYLQDKEATYPQECYFIGLLIATGCRASEIYLRKWNDIDWNTKQLKHVDTKVGTRSIDLSDTAVDLFKRLKPHTYDYSQYCFPSRWNMDKPRKTFREFWYDLRDTCGLKKTDQMRDLRHHFASIVLDQTQDMATVSALLGHSTVTTTSKHYAHVLTETKQKRLKQTGKKFKLL
jgi:integrase